MSTRHGWLLALLLLLSGVLATEARADHPPYLLLTTPRAPAAHQPHYGDHPGTGWEVSRHSFSYGWFGATPRRHWRRHFGYYRNYHEWSAR